MPPRSAPAKLPVASQVDVEALRLVPHETVDQRGQCFRFPAKQDRLLSLSKDAADVGELPRHQDHLGGNVDAGAPPKRYSLRGELSMLAQSVTYNPLPWRRYSCSAR